jgi:hypothetical protein
MKTNNEIKTWSRETWKRGTDHFAKLARECTDPSSQLACFTLADYCMYEDYGERGGPTPEMIQLAESILGVYLDNTISGIASSGLMIESTPLPQPPVE